MSLDIRSVEIRVAASTDAFAACNVLRRSITECCVLDHRDDPAILGAWLGNKTPQMVANWFGSPTNYCLVAVLDGDVVGVALLTGAGKLALCYLLPEARGHGAGRALLAKMEEQACSWGVKALQLDSTASGASFFRRAWLRRRRQGAFALRRRDHVLLEAAGRGIGPAGRRT